MRLREKATLCTLQDNESDYHEELQIGDIELEAEITEWDQTNECKEDTSHDYE